MWTLGILGALAAVCVVALALVVRSLRRRNRVVPDVRSPAPLSWLASPGQGARLHRRLRAAVATARLAEWREREAAASVETDPGVAAVSAGIQQHAAALDRHLVVAATAPRSQRRALLQPLGTQIDQVEELAARMARNVAVADVDPPRLSHHPLPLDDLAESLDALEQARAEITLAETAGGLSPARRGRVT